MADEQTTTTEPDDGHVPTEKEVRESPRMKMMELLGARHDEYVNMEVGGTHSPKFANPVGVPGGGPDGPAATEDAGQSQINRQLQQSDPGKQETSDSGTMQKVKVTIDGQEREVSVDDLVRSYQKGETADQRLERATEMLRRAQEAAHQVQQQLDAGTPASTQGTSTPSRDQQDGADKAARISRAKEVISSMFDGDEDQAAERLDALIEGRAKELALSQEQIVSRAAELAVPVLKREALRDKALDEVQRDYPSVFSDWDQATLANAHAGRLLAEGNSEAQAILGAAEYVAAKFGLQKQGRQADPNPKPDTEADLAKRLEMKRAADPMPAGLGVGARPANEPAVQSASDTIQEMRRVRGQAA